MSDELPEWVYGEHWLAEVDGEIVIDWTEDAAYSRHEAGAFVAGPFKHVAPYEAACEEITWLRAVLDRIAKGEENPSPLAAEAVGESRARVPIHGQLGCTCGCEDPGDA